MTLQHRYVACLAAGLSARHDVLRPPLHGHRSCAVLAAAAGLFAVVVAASGGYHAGFGTINAAGARMPNHLLQMLTYCGDTLFALLLLLPALRRFPQIVWLGLVAALTAALISHTLKPLVDSARPPAVLAADTFHLVGTAYRSRSFPSGHTVTAFVAAGAYVYFLPFRSLRVLLLGVACLVGLSRVAVGVHWPVDTLAGAAIGLGSVAFAGWLTARWRSGLGFGPYHAIVTVLAATAVGALFVRAPYDAATPLLHTTACVGLTIVLRDFVVLPLLAARAAIVRVQGAAGTSEDGLKPDPLGPVARDREAQAIPVRAA